MRRADLKNARLAAGLAAIDLAEILGTTEQRVYDLERGRYRPRPTEAKAWAEALAMPLHVAWPEIFTMEATR